MTRQFIGSAFPEGDYLPTGEFAVPVPGVGVRTHLGMLPLPAGETVIRYPAITNVGGFQIAAQPQATVRGAWVWNGTKWTTDARIPPAPNSTIYDNAGVLHVNELGPHYVGSNGYRYVTPSNVVISGDATYAARNGVAEWIDLSLGQDGSLLVGYAAWAYAVIVWDGAHHRLVYSGDVTRLRARRTVEGIALAIAAKAVADEGSKPGCLLIPTTEAELRGLPVFEPAPPTDSTPTTPPPPVPPPPPQNPSEPPVPQAAVPFDWSSAIVAGGSVDVRTWSETAAITHVQCDPDGLAITFTKQNDWPDVVPPGFTGPIQFTLWIAEQIDGKWYLLPVLEFWRGGKNGGNITAVVSGKDQIQANWCYWADPLSGHPVPAGEQIGLFVTAGDRRHMSVGPVSERSNIVFFARPAAVPAGFDFAGVQPPAPNPPRVDPPPTPQPADDPRFAMLQTQIDTIKLLLANLPPPAAPPDLSGYAKKGDPVSVSGSLFGIKIAAHGSIDR